jgi:hypothetical protein
VERIKKGDLVDVLYIHIYKNRTIKLVEIILSRVEDERE